MKKKLFFLSLCFFCFIACNKSNKQTTNSELTQDLYVPENLADAVKYDDIDSCRKLLENGAAPDQIISYKDENLSLLYYSVETGKIEIAKLLIEYGADVNWTYAESWTPFVLAMYREEEELLQIMLGFDLCD